MFPGRDICIPFFNLVTWLLIDLLSQEEPLPTPTPNATTKRSSLQSELLPQHKRLRPDRLITNTRQINPHHALRRLKLTPSPQLVVQSQNQPCLSMVIDTVAWIQYTHIFVKIYVVPQRGK